MSETDLERLQRWELNGAAWRVRSIDAEGANVEFLTCHGEPVDELHSSDLGLLDYVAARPSSEHSPD